MVAKKIATQRTERPASIVLILSSGNDFFGDLPGGIEKNLPLLRRAWADAEIRRQVYERKRPDGARPWAESAFGVKEER